MEKILFSVQNLILSTILVLTLPISSQGKAGETPFPLFDPELVLISSIQNINLHYSDSVSEGCWRNPSSTLDTVELSLRRNKFGVDRGTKEADGTTTFENPFLATLEVYAMGYELSKTSCVVYIKVDVSGVVGISLPTPSGEKDKTGLTLMSLYQRSQLMSGSKQAMQERISQSAVEFTEGAMLEILRAQESLKKDYPDYWKFLGE